MMTIRYTINIIGRGIAKCTATGGSSCVFSSEWAHRCHHQHFHPSRHQRLSKHRNFRSNHKNHPCNLEYSLQKYTIFHRNAILIQHKLRTVSTSSSPQSLSASIFGQILTAITGKSHLANEKEKNNPIVECFKHRYNVNDNNEFKNATPDDDDDPTTKQSNESLSLSSSSAVDNDQGNNSAQEPKHHLRDKQLLNFSMLGSKDIKDALETLLQEEKEKQKQIQEYQERQLQELRQQLMLSSSSSSSFSPLLSNNVNTIVNTKLAPYQSLYNITVAMKFLFNHVSEKNEYNRNTTSNTAGGFSIDDDFVLKEIQSKLNDALRPERWLGLGLSDDINDIDYVLLYDTVIETLRKEIKQNLQQRQDPEEQSSFLLEKRRLLWSLSQLLQERYNIDQLQKKNVEQALALRDALEEVESRFVGSVSRYHSICNNKASRDNASPKQRKAMNTQYLADMYQCLGIQNELLTSFFHHHQQQQYPQAQKPLEEISNMVREEVATLTQYYSQVQGNILQLGTNSRTDTPTSSSSYASESESESESNLTYIQNLQRNVSKHLIPMFEEQLGNKQNARDRPNNASIRSSLGELLAPTGSGSTSGKSAAVFTKSTPYLEQILFDKKNMIQLQDHVTLDGALLVLSQLTNDVFGVTIVEDNFNDEQQLARKTTGSTGWNDTVRLFHVYKNKNNGTTSAPKNDFVGKSTSSSNDFDGKQYMGSFYIDPYKRENKSEKTFTMPLLECGSGICGDGTTSYSRPVVVASFQFRDPYWKNEPTYLTWDDCVSLFHEFGHIYQFLLVSPPPSPSASTSTLSSSLSSSTVVPYFCGPEFMPYDFTEFLPKLMEHWLLEKSTIYALIGMSNSKKPFSDEEIESAYRVRGVEKAYHLTQSAFLSALELHLFTTYDIRGDESLVSVQQRFASQFVPHEIQPKEDDITPLLEIFEDNASGKKVSMYRYLWCDCLAAVAFQRIKKEYETVVADQQHQHQHHQREQTQTHTQGVADTVDRNNTTVDPLLCIRTRLQKFLLEPGAAIDIDEFCREFHLTKYVTPNALFERYGLVTWQVPAVSNGSHDE